MDDFVLVGHLDIGNAVLPQRGVNRVRRVAIEHENLPEMRLRCPQKVKAISFRLTEGLLVAEDDFLVVFLKLAGGDESATLELGFRAITRHPERLRIEINAGFEVANQNLRLAPVL